MRGSGQTSVVEVFQMGIVPVLKAVRASNAGIHGSRCPGAWKTLHSISSLLQDVLCLLRAAAPVLSCVFAENNAAADTQAGAGAHPKWSLTPPTGSASGRVCHTPVAHPGKQACDTGTLGDV